MTRGSFIESREGRWQAPRINYSHDALVDQIIANPTATNKELGDVFGRSATWVSLVKNSNLFQERLHARKAELTDPLIAATVEERLEMLSRKSLQVLLEKLEKPVDAIPDSLALEAAKLGAKGLGVGGFSSRPAVTVELPAPDRIERLAERLNALNGRPQEIQDVEARERPAMPSDAGHADAAAVSNGLPRDEGQAEVGRL